MHFRLPPLRIALVLCALFLLGVLSPGVFSPGVAEAGEKNPPAGLHELGLRLNQLAKDIEKLIAEANKDPDERKIEVYMRYSSQQLKKLRKRIHASELVAYMVDPSKNFKIRDKAREAIEAGAIYKGDPDLSATEKKGTRTKRSWFSDKYLVKHLKDDDRASRKLTHVLLGKLWGGTRSVPEIARYSSTDSKTWKVAIRQWSKYLRGH